MVPDTAGEIQNTRSNDVAFFYRVKKINKRKNENNETKRKRRRTRSQ